MQQKWIDRPAADTDWFDLAIELSNGFFRRHFSLAAKVAPPLFGFGIFVFYFYRNHFYPSFDLFQFSSLLLAINGVSVIDFINCESAAEQFYYFHLLLE